MGLSYSSPGQGRHILAPDESGVKSGLEERVPVGTTQIRATSQKNKLHEAALHEK